MKKNKIIQITINNAGQIIALTSEGKIFTQEFMRQPINYTDGEGNYISSEKGNLIWSGKWIEIKLDIK